MTALATPLSKPPAFAARLPFYYGWVNVFVAALAMVGTLPVMVSALGKSTSTNWGEKLSARSTVRSWPEAVRVYALFSFARWRACSFAAPPAGRASAYASPNIWASARAGSLKVCGARCMSPISR